MLGSIDIIKSVYEGLNIYRKNFPGEQRQILDPLTTMIKLAILGYKPQGTKLAIDNNKIYFQEPSFTQGLLRWAYGNKRYELHHLLNPIVKAVKRCDLTNPSIRSIFNLAINGLERLKSSYNNSSSVVIHSLDLYTNIINNVLVNDNKEENRIKTNSLIHTVQDDDEMQNNISIFSNLWLDEEINLVAKMLHQIQTSQKDAKTYLDAINTILLMKEDRANVLIAELSERL
jgi:hypothetical protein